MTDARSEILERIRQALPQAYLPAVVKQVPAPPAPPPFDRPLAEVFAAALADMRGELHRLPDRPAAREFLQAEFKRRQVTQLLCWDTERWPDPGLAAYLKASHIELVSSRLPGLRRKQDLQRLSSIEVGLTGADAGLARTGSLVLVGSREQGRLASLMPPVHYALLRVDLLYPDLAAWLAAPGIHAKIAASSSTVVITGPSRTADIAQTLTLGAHGPRELHVVLIG